MGLRWPNQLKTVWRRKAVAALGFIHFKAGHLKEARRFFENSLALAPHADENDYIRGYLRLCGE